MSEKQLVPIISDLVSFAAGGGGGTFSQLLEKLLKRRSEEARRILLNEIRFGERQLHDESVEEFVAILQRYLRAAQEGSARTNLRMMARLISGQYEKGYFQADSFLYYSNILADLRKEEILILSYVLKFWEDLVIVENLEERLSEKRPLLSEIWQKICNDLVPVPFRSVDLFYGAVEALTRTGLLFGDKTIDGIGYYRPSPLLDELIKSCAMEEVIESELETLFSA